MGAAADTQSFPISFPVSGQTDANGDAEITVFGFLPSLAAAWNLYMNLPGNSPQVQVFQGAGIGGIPIGSAGAVAGQCQVGPIYSYGSAMVTISIVGAEPNLPIQGMISGLQSSDPSDLSAIVGQSTGTVGTVTAYDGPTLLNEQGVSHTADITYPVGGGTYDVRLWASVLLGLRVTSGTGSFLMTFRWFANEDGTRLVGQRALILDAQVKTAVATLLNLGPFLQVVVNHFVDWTWNASLLPSNRQTADVFGGNFNPYLLEQNNTAIGGGSGTTVTTPLLTLYGGPVWLAQRAGNSPNNVIFRVTSMDSTGVYRAGNVWNNLVNAGVNEYTRIVLPASPCRAEFVNQAAGAITVDCYIYASETGGT